MAATEGVSGPQPRTFKAAPWKALLLASGSAFFLIVFGWAVLDGGEPGAWLGLIVCVIGSALSAIQLVSPASLVLDEQGFSYKWLGRGFGRRWADVERFEIYDPATGLRHERRVGYFLRSRPDGAIDRLNRTLGADRFLPGGWAVSPNELLAIMRNFHSAYGGLNAAEADLG